MSNQAPQANNSANDFKAKPFNAAWIWVPVAIGLIIALIVTGSWYSRQLERTAACVGQEDNRCVPALSIDKDAFLLADYVGLSR